MYRTKLSGGVVLLEDNTLPKFEAVIYCNVQKKKKKQNIAFDLYVPYPISRASASLINCNPWNRSWWLVEYHVQIHCV